MAQPVVSVVSPFFNRASLLPALIATLERQEFQDFELVIADDGSTDGLADAVRRINPPFHVKHLPLGANRGAAAARNAGIDAAEGRYIALLDSDDAWHPDKLRLQVAQLEATADGALVSLTRQLVLGRRSYVAPRCIMTPGDRVGPYLFLKGGIIQSSMMLLRRELAVSARFDDSSRGHDDWGFALRLEAAGARFQMLAAPLTIYDDGTGRERRSPSYSPARLDWLSARRNEIGEEAYWAAVAAVASRLRAGAGVRPLTLIAAAYRAGAISAPRAAYYGLAWAVPPARSLARAALETWSPR